MAWFRQQSRVRALLWAGVGVVVTTTAGAAVLIAALGGGLSSSSGRSAMRGDFNCDGIIDWQDINAFVLAVNDPTGWCERHRHDLSYLREVGDFNADDAVNLRDIDGFAEFFSAQLGLAERPKLRTAATRTMQGPVDLDIDSDNSNGTGSPARDPNEDAIEDDPYLPGKEIALGSGAYRAVLEFEATGQTPLTDLTFRLTFPDEVSVAEPNFYDANCPGNGQTLSSGTAYSYPYCTTWILGDMNHSGTIDNFDLNPYILALSNKASYKATWGMDPDVVGDMNGDWTLDNFDTSGFVALLANPTSSPIPVRLLVTGVSPSAAQGETRLVADADIDGDTAFDPNDADPVRVTVYDPNDGLPPPPGPGAADAWGAGLGVSPFSTVNLRNGNVLTAIPLVSWDPVGPPVSFTLYHNSATAPSGTDSTAWGFDLGGGWSVSYGGHVEGEASDAAVTVVEADGRRNVFTKEGSQFIPPAGVHDTLVWDGAADEWVLTSPNQWRAVFDAAGRLIELRDSSGNVSTIDRDPQADYRIRYVTSAADNPGESRYNRLEFTYNGYGQLWFIKDPINRTWTFEYDPNTSQLCKIDYPSDSTVPASYVEFEYYTGADASRIAGITSRDGLTWTYTYTDDQLTEVQDPNHDTGSGTVRYEQEFSYATTLSSGLWATNYTDRRSYPWVVRFDTLGNAREVTDPLEHTRSWVYDADHNPTAFTDELSHTWTATYGPVGNVETVTSPIQNQTWTLCWDDPDPNRPNFYRLTQVADPLAHWVQYGYSSDPNADPTLVTTYTEMPAEPNGPTTVTTLEYYGSDPNDVNARGQLKLLIDGNQVHHYFEYDAYGYLTLGKEGLCTEARAGWQNEFQVGPNTNTPIGGTGTKHIALGYHCGAGFDCDVNGSPMFCSLDCTAKSAGPFTRLGSTPSPQIVPMAECFSGAEYDVVGRLLHVGQCQPLPDPGSYRECEPVYDDLGRESGYTITAGATGPTAWEIERTYQYTDADADGHVTSATGPDGLVTQFKFQDDPGFDQLGRPETVLAGDLSVVYTWDEAGRPTRVDHKNLGTIVSSVVRHYDDGNRLEWIEHRDPNDAALLRIEYLWNLDNTMAQRTEYDYTVSPTQTTDVTFTYDQRDRLVGETRVVNQTTTVYDLEYTYDGLGNRLTKTDWAASPARLTEYYYDADPNNREPGNETNNNRLLWYEERLDDGNGGWDLARTVRYVYYQTGDVANITIKDEYLGSGDPNDFDVYRDLALYYTTGGRLWRALWDTWELDGQGQVTDYTKVKAREFYYDGLVERYLARDVVPGGSEQFWTPTGTWQWTDYHSGSPYGDFTLTPGNSPVEETRYLPGLGMHAQQSASTGATRYFHGDLIDSTVMMTDEDGVPASSLAYSAFGEPIGDAAALGTRYQYAGGSAYESGLLTLEGAPNTAPVNLLHVGARWYDPALGRFIQRDSIGLLGGLNAYLYCAGNPLALVDASGCWVGSLVGGLVGGALGFWQGGSKGGIRGAFTGLVGGLTTGILTGSGLVSPNLAAAAGGAVSGFLTGLLGGLENHYSLGRSLVLGVAGAGIGFAVGGLTGWATEGLLGSSANQIPLGKELRDAIIRSLKPLGAGGIAGLGWVPINGVNSILDWAYRQQSGPQPNCLGGPLPVEP